jgi:hypothetical protein
VPDPVYAERPKLYKVEKWSRDGLRVELLLYAGYNLDTARRIGRASTPVTNGMKIVTAHTIVELLSRAAASPRKRANLNLHTELSDPTNRFLNAGLSGTYVRPHCHRIGKWELVSARSSSSWSCSEAKLSDATT